jgi:hypothetical protein
MGLFDQFPYTNFHELNLDWILKALKELEHTIDQFVAINALKYADPIQWDITSQYEKNTIVIDPQTGTAYISVQPVPIGVSLTNPDYWTVVFDLGSFVVRAAKNLANTYEAETTLTATVNTPAGGWLVWGDTLYKALVNITAGDSYVEGGNIAHFTIEEVTGHLEDLSTTDKSNLVAAINEVAVEVIDKIGDLADLDTIDQSNIVAAINEVIGNIGDLADLDTSDQSSIVNAINEALASSLASAENAAKNFALLYEATGTTEATISSTIGDWLVIGTTLYIVIAPITIGDTYTENTNIVKNTMIEIIGALTSLNTSTKSSIVAAINEVLSDVGDLTSLNTSIKTSIVAAINEVLGNVGDLTDLNTTDKTSIVNAINEIEGEIGSINTQKRVISISDSYGMGRGGTTPWTTFLQTYMELDNADYFTWSEGSMGFNRTGDNGHKVKELLEAHENDVTSPNTISHVIIGLGLNDMYGLTGLNTAIDDCMTYIKTTYPNAKIYVGMIGNVYTKNSTTFENYMSVIENYILSCGQNGVAYIHGAEYPMHNMQLLQADGLHPSTVGSQAIAEFVASYVNGGASYAVYEMGTVTAANFGASSYLKQSINNDVVCVAPLLDYSSSAVAFTRNSALDVGTIDSPIIAGIGGYIHYALCFLYDGTDYIPATWYVYNGHLYIMSTKTITLPSGALINFLPASYPTLEA